MSNIIDYNWQSEQIVKNRIEELGSNTVTCANCGEVIDLEDSIEYNGKFYCDNCFYNNFRRCDYCENYFPNDEIIFDSNDFALCENCYNDFVLCENCGRFVHVDEMRTDDYGNYYCRDCYEEVISVNSINDYDYKPTPEFFGNDSLYLGIELEVDSGGENSNIAEQVNDILGYTYCKHDGSLHDGFEIVTHPANPEYHYSKNWNKVMDCLKDNNYVSHDSGTAGLHIHVNKDFFGNTETEQDLYILKILYLFEKNWNDIKLFSRRTSEQVNDWCKRYGLIDFVPPDIQKEELLNTAKHSGRYYAINLCNRHTIEFRIFRGTLKYNTFIATIQFITNLCQMVKDIDISELDNYKLSDFITDNDPELKKYMNERGIV